MKRTINPPDRPCFTGGDDASQLPTRKDGDASALVRLSALLVCCTGAWLASVALAEVSRDPLDATVRELRNPSASVRTGAAIVFINRTPDPTSQRHLPELMAALHEERDASVRAYLVMALGNTGAGHTEVLCPWRTT